MKAKDAKKYAEKLLAWWDGIQPPARRRDAGKALPLAEYNHRQLRLLRRGGENGLVTVFLGLYWWGMSGNEVVSWRAALADVRACIGAMLSDDLAQ